MTALGPSLTSMWAGCAPRRVTVALLVAAGMGLGCMRMPSPLVPSLSKSVGGPARGLLIDGEELPASGVGFRWLRPQGHHFGVSRLVRAIQAAASWVHQQRPGGPPLAVGDLSGRRGGRIPGHRSHRSGRDADLLFYALTPSGEPVESPGFVRFGTDGLAPVSDGAGVRFVRFDVDREWLLIKRLLLSPDANVQWLFISRPLEALVTEHARALGEPDEVVWHAETIMRQPSDSAPHDDHLHLRTACLPDETITGCEGGGPYWPWLPETDPADDLDDDALVAALMAPFEERASAGLHGLSTTEATSGTP